MDANERANTIYEFILNEIVIPAIGSKTTFQNDLQLYGKRMLGEKFHGVFASDLIPKLTKRRPYAILNLDKSNEPGSHWIAVSKNGNGVIVYDSFGRKSAKIIPDLMTGNGEVLDTEYDAEQDQRETNCGARSMAFLMLQDGWGTELSRYI